MLDLMQALIERTDAQNAALLTLIDARETSAGEVLDLLKRAEALGALPAWMIEQGKRAAGAEQ